MPLNRFNQHYLASCSDDIVTTATPFYICQPSKHHSKCILTIRGTKHLATTHYILDNTTTTYVFPVTGKVENVSCFPEQIEVNYKKQTDNIEQLVNDNIVTKGDTLQFPLTVRSLADNIYVEFVIQCHLEKDV